MELCSFYSSSVKLSGLPLIGQSIDWGVVVGEAGGRETLENHAPHHIPRRLFKAREATPSTCNMSSLLNV